MSNNSPPGSGGESITFLGDFSKKLAVNTLFNFLGRFWAFIAMFLLTPYILRHLTPNEFGVWVIFSVFASSFTLLDFGLGSAFVKFISMYDAHQDTDSINRVIYSGLAFYAVLGAAFIGVGWLVRELLFGWLGIRGVTNLPLIYLLSLIACALANVAAMFVGVFRGIQRMDKSNAVEIGGILLNFAGTVIVLQAGFGITGLAFNAAGTAMLSVIIAWQAVRRSVPRLAHGKPFDGRLLAEMFRYGTKILVSRIGSVVCFQLPNLIVAKFSGVAAVPFYEVSARLAASMRAVPLLMISALIPATSQLSARNEKEKIVRAYSLASRYVALVTIGLGGFVMFEASSILRLWLGDAFQQSTVLVQMLVLGYGANVLGGPASQTGAGVGRPEFDMRSTLLLTFLSPALGLMLVRSYGIPGVAAGTALALATAAVYLLFTFHRHYLQTSIRELVRDTHLRPIAAAAMGAAALLVLRRLLPGLDQSDLPRHLLAAGLALHFLVFSCVYVIALVALRQITFLDWKNFTSLMAFGYEFLRHPFRQRVKIYR